METAHTTGRSVRLFLADGTPSGIVLGEIGNWTGKVLVSPRARLGDLLARPESRRTGVYVLLGPDPERMDGQLAYIGEADDIAARMRNHLRSEARDFADRFAFIVSSDETLTKAHVRYLEGRLIKLVTEAGSVALTNDTAPDFQRLPESDRADMDYFLDQLRLILPLLGFDLFRQRRADNALVAPAAGSKAVFTMAAGGATGRAIETDEGFLVLAGSSARRGESGTFPAGYRALRDKLLADGQLAVVNGDNLYQFMADVSFSSPTAAASIIAGRSASGPLEWKLEGNGQPYRDWRAKQLDLSPALSTTG